MGCAAALTATISHAVALQVTYNVLIMVCIDNQQLDRAGEVHDLSIQAGLHPDTHAYNALINAYGSKCQVSPPLLVALYTSASPLAMWF